MISGDPWVADGVSHSAVAVRLMGERQRGTPLKVPDSVCDIMLVNVNAFTSVSYLVQ